MHLICQKWKVCSFFYNENNEIVHYDTKIGGYNYEDTNIRN